ncbi:MAG: hypothetical protein JXC33_07200 [Deltaproteobacteria bacterium]|nr:hypothetical protein [Deltaproteobacteria bacterium]
MKNLSRCITIVVVVCLGLGGCASKAVPQWQTASFNHMETFKQHYLAGDEQNAERYFSKAIADIKKSGRIDILAKGYLTKYAIQAATLEAISGTEFLEINNVRPDRINMNFYTFLTGTFDTVDNEILPPRYKQFIVTFQDGTINELNRDIAHIKDPLSRLIAVGLTIKHRRYNEATLKIALNTASVEGWKKALVAYLKQIQSLYENTGHKQKAEQIQKQLNIIINKEK